jgi:hypothetical protein
VIKYKKQIEVIPELKAELQDMRSTVEMVSQNMNGGAFGMEGMTSAKLSSSHNITSGANNVIFDANGK